MGPSLIQFLIFCNPARAEIKNFATRLCPAGSVWRTPQGADGASVLASRATHGVEGDRRASAGSMTSLMKFWLPPRRRDEKR